MQWAWRGRKFMIPAPPRLSSGFLKSYAVGANLWLSGENSAHSNTVAQFWRFGSIHIISDIEIQQFILVTLIEREYSAVKRTPVSSWSWQSLAGDRGRFCFPKIAPTMSLIPHGLWWDLVGPHQAEGLSPLFLNLGLVLVTGWPIECGGNDTSELLRPNLKDV